MAVDSKMDKKVSLEFMLSIHKFEETWMQNMS